MLRLLNRPLSRASLIEALIPRQTSQVPRRPAEGPFSRTAVRFDIDVNRVGDVARPAENRSSCSCGAAAIAIATAVAPSCVAGISRLCAGS